MSEYSFGYDETDGDPSGLGETTAGQQGPKWFREGLGKLSDQVKELKAENERLQTEKRQSQVADALKAKGYAPTAATLFTGEPDQLDTWLTTHGEALAKLPPAPGEGDGESEAQPPAGPPASSVPADGQDQMRRMSEAGTTGTAAPQGSEAELVAKLKSATPQEYADLMRAHGNRYDWTT